MSRRLFTVVFTAAIIGAGCSGDGDAPDADVVQLRIDPGTALILGAEGAALSAVATDKDGAEFAPEGVRWSSSSADIQVDAQGVATSQSETVSAWVTASVGNVTSEPILVVAAVASDGVIPLEDARFVSEPEITSEDIATIDELRVQAVLSGPAPAVDALVMATGDAAFAGRVLDVQPDGSNNLVTVQGVAIETLFKELDINVERGWSSTASSASSLTEGIGHTRAGLNAGPFECKTTAAAELADLNVLINPVLDSSQLKSNFILLIDNNGLSDFEIITQGPFSITVDGSIELPLQLTAKITCTIRPPEVPVIPKKGIWALINIEAYAEFALAFEAVSNTVAVRLLANGAIEGIVRTGIDYNKLSDELVFLDDAEFADNIDLSLDNANGLSDESEVNIKPSMSLALGSQMILTKKFKRTLFEWKAKSGSTLSFATIKRQIADPAFAASRNRAVTLGYEIKTQGMAFAASWMPGISSLVAVAAYFKDDVTLSVALYDSKSATGTMTAPASITVGDTGDFVIDLQDVNDFLSYDVQEVQIIKHSGVGTALTTQVVATLSPSADGQTQFTWQWTPDASDVGNHTFSAFVITKESPLTPFEIEASSSKTVTVEEDAVGGAILRRIEGNWDVDCTAVIRDPMSHSDQDHRTVIEGGSTITTNENLNESCSASLTVGPTTVTAETDARYQAQTMVSGDALQGFTFHADADSTETIAGWSPSSMDHFANALPRTNGAAEISFEVTEPTPFTLTTDFSGPSGNRPVLFFTLSCTAANPSMDSVGIQFTDTATTMTGILPVGGAAGNCGLILGFNFETDHIPNENDSSAFSWSVDVNVSFQ